MPSPEAGLPEACPLQAVPPAGSHDPGDVLSGRRAPTRAGDGHTGTRVPARRVGPAARVNPPRACADLVPDVLHRSTTGLRAQKDG